MQNTDLIKSTLAAFALQKVELSGLIGLGSGTTVEAFLHALGNDFKNEPSKFANCQFIASSKKTETLAKNYNLQVLTIDQIIGLTQKISFYIDGLDQIDSEGRMIKGKGGALTREKILCTYSQNKLFLCDNSKVSKTLTSYLPAEIIPLAYPFIKAMLHKELKIEAKLRMDSHGKTFITDNGNWIIDLYKSNPTLDWFSIKGQLLSYTGIIETGLFTPNPFELFIGYPDKKVERMKF